MAVSQDLKTEEAGKSLLSLRPDLFSAGAPLASTDILRAPVEMRPQMGLHWIAVSSACSLNPEFAANFAHACEELGGDILSNDAIPDVKRAGVVFPTSEGQKDFKVLRITPLGSAILNRNTQALGMFTQLLLSRKIPGDPDLTAARLQTGTHRVDLNVWSFCAHLGEKLPLDSLVNGFRIDADSAEHEQRLGLALNHMMDQGKGAQGLDTASSQVRDIVRGFLKSGALPDPVKIRQSGVDPARLVGLVCADRSLEALKSLRRLIQAQFPVDPASSKTEVPLHLAAFHDNGAALLALLNAGANPRLLDARGQTLEAALHQDNRQELIDILRSWTARKFALDAMGLFNVFSMRKAHPQPLPSLFPGAERRQPK